MGETEIVRYRGIVRSWLVRELRGVVALLCCLTGGWSAAQESTEPPAEEMASPAVEEDTRQRLMISTGLGARALAERFPQAAVWLENSDGGSELALLEPANRPEAKGALLLLAGEGQSGAGGFEGSVRQLLPDRGWTVMTLGLPVSPLSQPLARPIPATPEPESEAEVAEGALAASGQVISEESVMIDVMAPEVSPERFEKYRERVRSTLAAAMTELRARGHQRVVLAGVGMAAEPVMQAALAGGEPAELVWIAPRFSADSANSWPERLAGVERWPLLDLTSSLEDRTEARSRAAAFRRQGIAGYQQQALALALPLSERDAPKLINRMVAWLTGPQSY